MIKKIYGISETGEKVELEYKEFLMVTDNNSELIMTTVDVDKHPLGADLMLQIPVEPLTSEESASKSGMIDRDFHCLTVLPGASNWVFIKAVCKKRN